MLPDCHMHTSFSGDCKIEPEIMIETAISKGLCTITLTDHLDIDYPNEPDLFMLDLEKYAKTVHTLKEKYRDEIELLYGIEIGLQPHLANKHHEIANLYDFDYIIGSSHVVHGQDPYYPEFFEGRSELSAFREYFESVLENITVFDDFDSYGHLDYVVRYSPSKKASYDCYEELPELIDEILRLLVSKNKALEVNTGAFKYNQKSPNPTASIIRRYLELGGKYITCGADAHKPENISDHFDEIENSLRGTNLEYITVFKKRTPMLIPLVP